MSNDAIHVDRLTKEQRCLAPQHHIDPGFINQRLCLSTLGPKFREFVSAQRRPGSDHFTNVANDHMLVDATLKWCASQGVGTLGQVLADPHGGSLFCSTEQFEGAKDVYESERVRNRVLLPYECSREVVLEFHTSHIVSDTGRLELSRKAKISALAGIRSVTDTEIVAHPLIMGAPSYEHPSNSELGVDLMWYGWSFYQLLPQDIDEFASMEDVAAPTLEEWTAAMSRLSEDDVKTRLCAILGEAPKSDWGGEQDDHFSSSLHIGGRGVTGAFLLKGPSRFREMTPDMLGKRADQI